MSRGKRSFTSKRRLKSLSLASDLRQRNHLSLRKRQRAYVLKLLDLITPAMTFVGFNSCKLPEFTAGECSEGLHTRFAGLTVIARTSHTTSEAQVLGEGHPVCSWIALNPWTLPLGRSYGSTVR